MNCEEFLRLLQETLDGKVSERIIADNVDYYKSYIRDQMTSGRSESEVLQMLGDPRLLAKTIEESTKFASGRTAEQKSYTNEDGNYSSFQNRDDGYIKQDYEKRIKFPLWLIAGIILVIFIFVVLLAYRVLVIFAPVIMIFLLAGFIYRTAKNWFHK